MYGRFDPVPERITTGVIPLVVSVTLPFDPERAASGVSRLEALLEANDGDSQEAFQVLHDAVVGVVDARCLDELSETINNFEFEQALVKLQEIAQLCRRNGSS